MVFLWGKKQFITREPQIVFSVNFGLIEEIMGLSLFLFSELYAIKTSVLTFQYILYRN